MACNTEKDLFLTDNLLNQLVGSHDTIYIPGLTDTEQREVVNFMSNKLYREALITKEIEEQFTKADLQKYIVSAIKSDMRDNTASIALMSESEESAEDFKDNIRALEKNNETLQAVLDNIPKLINIARKYLSDIRGIDIERLNATEEDIARENSEFAETDAERTTFDDNFSLLLDSKTKASGKLKAFLSFIKKKTFLADGTTEPVRTFFNTEDYLDFSIVYDELHRLLEGAYPSFEDITNKLQNKFTEAKETGNSNLAWLEDLIDQIQKADETTKFMFVRDVAKHKVTMEFVYFKGKFYPGRYSGDPGRYYSTLSVLDDNASTSGRRLHKEWLANHLQAPVITKTGEYDPDKLSKHISSIEALLGNKKAETFLINKGYGIPTLTLRDYTNIVLEDLGIIVPEEFLDAVFENKLIIYGGTKYTYKTGSAFANALRRELEPMGGKVDTSKLNTSFIKGVASAAAKFKEDEFGNVFRVGDKLIYVYTANHHLYNKSRDLKLNKDGILDKLANTAFSSRSLYRIFLEDEENDFTKWFEMRYISLQPLMKKSTNGYRRSEEHIQLSDTDYELMKLGYVLRNADNIEKIYVSKTKEQLSVSKGSFVLPTFSDKSRGMLMNGYTFHVSMIPEELIETIETRNDATNAVKMNSAAINLYFNTVVKAEIDRIAKSANPDYLSKLDLDTYNGNLFYLTPYLNEVYFNEAGELVDKEAEGAQSLIDIIVNNERDPEYLYPAIKEMIKQDLEAKATDRYNEWNRIGLIKNDTLKHKNTMKSRVLGNDAPVLGIEAAMDVTFSEEFNLANALQLVIGDPSQYFKKDIAGTNSNITKRLAAEIAPGDEANYSGAPHYMQVFLNDRVSESKIIGQIMETLDDMKYSTYQNMQSKLENPKLDPDERLEIEQTIANLKSAPYLNIESTDAQEYLTWKTHIDEMLRYGELTREEHDTVQDIISKGKDLKGELLDKVLGPRKPVYSNTELQRIAPGAEEYFYRKTYIKSSTFPLLPQLVRGHQIEKLANELNRLENKFNMPVRAAYKTAVKVGFPKEGATIYDDDGNIVDDLNLEMSTRKLDSSGLRIQQAIPYKDTKSHIKKGSQEAKLLFSGMLDDKFTFKGKPITGTELQIVYNNTYQRLYLMGLSRLQDFIMDPTGKKLNYRKLSKLLLRELDDRREYSKPMRDGLKIDRKTGQFKLPLWQSEYADKYMALLNSLVYKHVLEHRLPGGSYVLGSEEGFVEWEKEGREKVAEAEKKGGITYIEGYDKKIGLLPQRVESGKVKPAQILLPFKFRDNDGNLLNVNDFIDKKTNTIDVTKLPDELRESFVFRIPTQLQQSMAYAEVVGFLPTAMGDLVIAPKDFVVQMGSDFDVDKLYQYMFNTKYEDGNLTKQEEITTAQVSKTLRDLDAQIETTERSMDVQLNAFTKDAIRINVRYRKKELLKTKIPKEEKRRAIDELIEEEWATFNEVRKQLKREKKEDLIEFLDKIQTLEIAKEQILEDYKRGLENIILDIHKTIMLEKSVQGQIVEPLISTTRDFSNIAEFVNSINEAEVAVPDSIISHRYNRKKIIDGAAGNDGIAIFSSDSVLNSLAQGKGLVVADYVEQLDPDTGKVFFVRIPINVKFGNQYEESNGKIGLTKTIKKKGKIKSPGNIISAMQNMSVDNANMELMSKINMNTETAGVYTILSMLGFEEDISGHLMSQPIIVEFVNKLAASTSMAGSYTPDVENTLIVALTKAYDPDYNPATDDELADFNGLDAAEIMKELLTQKEDFGDDYGKLQASLLNKFMILREHASKLRSLRPLLNLDAKGLDKNFYVTKSRLETASNLNNHPVINADKLLGKYGETGFDPTTLAGYDNLYGAQTLIQLFGNEFIETNPGFMFTTMVDQLKATLGKENLSDTELYDLRQNVVYYMNSQLRDVDVNKLRNLLFFDTSEGSLYSNIVAMKSTTYGKNNKLLQSISETIDEDGTVLINYDRVAGDTFDDTGIYMAMLDMMFHTGELENGIIPSDVAQQLVYYTMLKGGRRGVSLKKYIPMEVMRKITDPDQSFSNTAFIKQYIQNNSDAVNQFKNEDVNLQPNGSYTLKTKELPLALTINEGATLLMLDDHITGIYKEVEAYQGNDITYYDANVEGPLSIVDGRETMVENSGTVTNEINNTEEIETLEDFYDTLLLRNIPDDLKATFSALNNLNTNKEVGINFDELPENVDARYFTDTNSITINSDNLNDTNMSDPKFLRLLMHEQLHGLTVNNIAKYFADPTSVSPEIAKAIENLSDYMEEHVQRAISSSQGELDFKNFLIAQYDGIKTETLELIKQTSRNRIVKDTIDEVLLARENNESVYLDSKEDIDSSVQKILNDNNFDYYYALSSFYEFVAVLPTDYHNIKDKVDTVKYNNLIRDFIQAILKTFGITDTTIANILDDVYKIAQVTPVAQEVEDDVDISKSFNYADKVIEVEGFDFVDTEGITVASKINTPSIYKDLILELYNNKVETARHWEEAESVPDSFELVKSIKKGYIFTPIKGIATLSVLENARDKVKNKKDKKFYTKAINKLKRALGLDKAITEEKKLETQALEKNENLEVSTDKQYSDNEEYNEYINRVSKYATKTLGDNKLSDDVQDSTDLGKLTDSTEFDSLRNAGQELIERCGGVAKSGLKWRKISTTGKFKAAEGVTIVKTPMVKTTSQWIKVNTRVGKELKFGGFVKGVNNGISSKKWNVVKKLKGPSHSKGGIDLTIDNGKINIQRGGSELKAKCGMIIKNKVQK